MVGNKTSVLFWYVKKTSEPSYVKKPLPMSRKPSSLPASDLRGCTSYVNKTVIKKPSPFRENKFGNVRQGGTKSLPQILFLSTSPTSLNTQHVFVCPTGHTLPGPSRILNELHLESCRSHRAYSTPTGKKGLEYLDQNTKDLAH
jgi:hypothetical protein